MAGLPAIPIDCAPGVGAARSSQHPAPTSWSTPQRCARSVAGPTRKFESAGLAQMIHCRSDEPFAEDLYMELAERINVVAERLLTLKESIFTEEATKNGLVMPVLSALGYDVFEPLEVVPEFTADVGIKKGEKVDYAILRRREPVILIECKILGSDLDAHGSQLFRYFGTTTAKIGVLTDGAVWRFFTDLDAPNRMDHDPFMVLDLHEVKAPVVQELSKLAKSAWDLDGLLDTAQDLKNYRGIRTALASELANPSADFARHFADKVHAGRITQNVIDRIKPLITRAAKEHVNAQVETRLRAALEQSRVPEQLHSAIPEADDEIETTMEELEGFFIVKTLLCDQVDPARIVGRDVRSYFGVLLDDNNRKPICRLWFNGRQKYVGVFDSSKQERRISVDGPGDMYGLADELAASLSHLLKLE